MTLDRCFSDYLHKYTIDDLLDEVNDKLYDASGSKSMIMVRQLRSDINAIRKILPEGIYLDALPLDAKKCFYRYSDPDFSIFKNKIADLVISGNCAITMIIGNGTEEPYQGCEHNILMAMDDEYTTIEKLSDGYLVAYETYMGVCKIIIKESI